jgi:hypothetical protein
VLVGDEFALAVGSLAFTLGDFGAGNAAFDPDAGAALGA